ncbi:MAG: glycerol-3-phosphate acyltransferase [Trueperaceae bacterium]
MVEPALALLAGALAYVIGTVPVGAAWVHRLTGHEARDLNPHLLGVENVFRLAGAPAALGSFFLDLFKGAFAVAALGALAPAAAPLAAAGAYMGHVAPWPGAWGGHLPRGRGNGVLLGVLAGWAAIGGAPTWALAAPVVVYAAVLAASRYVAFGTLAGLATLPLALAVAGAGPWDLVAASGMAIVGGWRQKSAWARVRDGTEARLGDPPPVRGLDPNVVLAAFMVHPMTVDDLAQPRSQSWLRFMLARGWLPLPWLRWVLPHLRPQVQGEIRGVALPDGRELRMALITGPLLPDQIRSDTDGATRMAILGARLAREMGAEAFGLGAFWSTVGEKGLAVQAAVPDLAITNGGAYTAGTVRAAVPGLLERFRAEGGDLRRATAAVVGANGVVAFGVARVLAGEVGKLVLVGRDLERLERSAATLARKHPDVAIEVTTDVGAVLGADLIFTATNDPDPVVLPEHVKPGAWVYDLGRPADVHPDVADVPGVQVVPGGVVRPPGALRTAIDLHFGDGLVPACLAETMIMTATRAFDRASLGPQTRSADIDWYLEEGERLGFEIVTRDLRDAAPR